MPWEDILDDLKKNVVDRDFTEIPRPAECLKYILKVHLNVAGLDLKKSLKQLCVPAIRLGAVVVFPHRQWSRSLSG